MAATFGSIVSVLRQFTCGHHLHRLVTVMAMMATLLIAAAARADAQEVVEYYGTDAVGSIRVVFGADGTVKARSDYLPFGEEWNPTAPGGPLPPQRFTGQRRDAEENLDYFNARSYQTRTGRMTTVDPVYAGLFEPQRWNRYAYALNNPGMYVDPSGLSAMCTQSGYMDEDGDIQWYNDHDCVDSDVFYDLYVWIVESLFPTVYAPEMGEYDGGGALDPDPPHLPDPGTEPNGNVSDPTPAIVDGVTTVMSGGTATTIKMAAKEVGKGVARGVAREAGKKAKGAFGPSTANPSKGTTLPRDLRERYAVEEVMSAPGGKQLPFKMNDPRWKAEDGWVKMEQKVNPGGERINIHYVYNTRTGEAADFKIVIPGPRPRP